MKNIKNLKKESLSLLKDEEIDSLIAEGKSIIEGCALLKSKKIKEIKTDIVKAKALREELIKQRDKSLDDAQIEEYLEYDEKISATDKKIELLNSIVESVSKNNIGPEYTEKIEWLLKEKGKRLVSKEGKLLLAIVKSGFRIEDEFEKEFSEIDRIHQNLVNVGLFSSDVSVIGSHVVEDIDKPFMDRLIKAAQNSGKRKVHSPIHRLIQFN